MILDFGFAISDFFTLESIHCFRNPFFKLNKNKNGE